MGNPQEQKQIPSAFGPRDDSVGANGKEEFPPTKPKRRRLQREFSTWPSRTRMIETRAPLKTEGAIPGRKPHVSNRETWGTLASHLRVSESPLGRVGQVWDFLLARRGAGGV